LQIETENIPEETQTWTNAPEKTAATTTPKGNNKSQDDALDL